MRPETGSIALETTATHLTRWRYKVLLSEGRRVAAALLAV